MSHELYELLDRLDRAKLHYSLHRTQPDQVTIAVTLVEERIEIYVSKSGEVLFSRFKGSGGSQRRLQGPI